MPRQESKQFEISLQWRDENYGVVTAHSAFRAFIDLDMSDTAHKKVCQKFRKHGFQINHSRGAWIADRERPNYLTAMVAELEALGHVVKHEGNLPAALRQPGAAASNDPVEDAAPSMKM